jgi:factor associated with neutral sphingomyelinase activation
VWNLEEDRQPWDSTLPQPVGEVGDLPGGVWALDVALGGDSSSSSSSSSSAALGVLVGTEEGYVVYVDMRLPGVSKIAWQKEVSQDYIGGVNFLPTGSGVGSFGGCGGVNSDYYALAACADGTFALLDTRRGGDIVSTVNCGTSLRCCATDGALAIAGGESGAVHFWDVAQQLGQPPPAGAVFSTSPGLDGLYPSLVTTPASPVSSLAVKMLSKDIEKSGAGEGEEKNENNVCMVTGHEGGVVRVYWA